MTAPWEDRRQGRFLAYFSRVTTSGKFLPEIDGMRFIAITAVVALHITQYVNTRLGVRPGQSVFQLLLLQGWFGVEFFFCISGFILAQPFLAHHRAGAQPVRLRTYFLRRLTRLEPPYLIATLATFATYVVVRHVPFDRLCPSLLAALAYVHGFVFHDFSPIITPSWSLEVEVQFYLVVPLLTQLFAIPNTLARRATLVALMLAAGWYSALHFSYWIGLPVFLQYFLSGFLLADFFLLDWKENPSRGYAWDAVGIFGALLLILMLHHNGYVVVAPGPLVSVGSPFVMVMLATGIFRGKVLNAVFTTPLLTGIGGMCYSIYLLHFILINVAGRVTWQLSLGRPYHVHLVVQLILMSLFVLVCASVFFLAVEKPCMRPRWPERAATRLRNLRHGMAPPWRDPEA